MRACGSKHEGCSRGRHAKAVDTAVPQHFSVLRVCWATLTHSRVAGPRSICSDEFSEVYIVSNIFAAFPAGAFQKKCRRLTSIRQKKQILSEPAHRDHLLLAARSAMGWESEVDAARFQGTAYLSSHNSRRSQVGQAPLSTRASRTAARGTQASRGAHLPGRAKHHGGCCSTWINIA